MQHLGCGAGCVGCSGLQQVNGFDLIEEISLGGHCHEGTLTCLDLSVVMLSDRVVPGTWEQAVVTLPA